MVRARVTELVSPVAVLPYASCRVTTGWVASGTPLLLPPGWVVKTSLVVAPAVIAKVVLVAEVSDPSVAVSV